MKIGFIGAGNMAGAVMKGIISKGFIRPEDIYVFDVETDKLNEFTIETGSNACRSNEELVSKVDVVVLGVKPNAISKVLPPLRSTIVNKRPLIVSVAAGTTIEKIHGLIDKNIPIPIIRVMPNVNAMIGEGMSAICGNEEVNQEQIDYILNMFNSVGLAIELEEAYFSIFTAISGSAPAYAYLFIDSLARGALKAGMTKEQATFVAAQTVLGSAKMILESNEAPWVLIDKVCSPGGTTIAGLCALEEGNFISTVVKGVEATIKRDQEMMGK
jgi:pyrroline-5-carboxylate reductase